MDNDVSAWSLQVAAEQLGFQDLNEVPRDELGSVYELAEEIDY